MRTGSLIAMIGAVLSIATSSFARADDLGWFSGISARPLIKDVDVAGFNSRVDRSDAGQRVYSAYRINKSLGLELGYADSPKIDDSGSTIAPPGPFSGAVKARGWQLSGVGTLPLGERFGIFGRVGAYRGDVGLNANLGGAGDNGLRAMYGMGLKYDFNSNLRLQGTWDRFRLGSGRSAADTDSSLLSIGLKYKF